MKTDGAAEATRKLLATLWERNLPLLRTRVQELEAAAADACAGTLAQETRKAAGGTAHKLAGSLGMFGYQKGTEIARELEQMLDGPGEMNADRLGELVRDLRQQVNL